MADTLTAQARRIAQRLEAIPAEVLRHVQPALVASAEDTASVARSLAPEDDGDLKASIAVTAPGMTTPAHAVGGGNRTAADNQAVVTVGNPNVRHGHLVEFGKALHENGGIFEGTQPPGTDPQPFILPADRLTRQRNLRRIARAVGRGIRAAGEVRR